MYKHNFVADDEVAPIEIQLNTTFRISSIPVCHHYNYYKLWRIQELQAVADPGISKPARGAVPARYNFLGSQVCFDASFTHDLCFVVTVENKVHIVNTVWWLQLKYMRVIQ